jgi:hypothetical protein
MAVIVAFDIEGGLNLDAGPAAPWIEKAEGRVSVPYLVAADNVVFKMDGWPQKMPGASAVNASATGATDTVAGIYDYWRAGSGALTQKRVIVSGTAIYKDDADGVWDSLATGFEADKVPAFETMNDELIIASDSTTDVPQVYDQSTIGNLGGSPPNFSFCVEHKRRLFAAGVQGQRSRLYYSGFGAHEDWSGSGSGAIDVAPNDGDEITGLASHKDELIVFKGPNRNSLHRLTGSSPTGADAFSLIPFVKGVGCTSHNSIIRLGDDLAWWDQNGIHSLVATAKYGDYSQAFISAGISDWFLRELNHSRFPYVQGVNFTGQGWALWTVSRAGFTTNNLVVLFDYRFQPGRIAFWPAFNLASLAMVRDTGGSPISTVPWGGTYTGTVYRMNRTDRNIDGTGYSANIMFPYLSFGDAFMDKLVVKGRLALQPKGTSTFTVGYRRDGNTRQTVSVSQGGSGVLDSFILDTDVLGGQGLINRFFDMAGSFKELRIDLEQEDEDVDFEPHGMAVMVEPAGLGTVETLG